MLQGGEQVEKVGRRRLRPQPLADDQGCGPAALGGEARPPFTVPPVEDEHRVAVAQAENVEEKVGLAPLQREARASEARSSVRKSRGAAKS